MLNLELEAIRGGLVLVMECDSFVVWGGAVDRMGLGAGGWSSGEDVCMRRGRLV